MTQVSRATVRAMLVAVVCGVMLTVLLWVYSPWLMTRACRTLCPSTSEAFDTAVMLCCSVATARPARHRCGGNAARSAWCEP